MRGQPLRLESKFFKFIDPVVDQSRLANHQHVFVAPELGPDCGTNSFAAAHVIAKIAKGFQSKTC